MRVLMAREHLDEIPQHALPNHFSLRWYQPGDEAHWLRIHQLADLENKITPELFGQKFGSDATELARRQCYLISPEGEVFGTATAWYDDNFGGRKFGRVHYVAILQHFQGRGLSKPLMTIVCRRLHELGHQRAYLTTSTTRLPAIRLYLGFGFLPLKRNAEEAKSWEGICSPGPAGQINMGQCRNGQNSGNP